LTLYGDALTPDLRMAIASELDDLLLPYTIDLSIFDELHHAKLREHIERVGVVFYERKKQGASLKEGREHKQIGDLCEVIAGQSPEGKFYNTDGEGMPFYQGKKDFGEKFIKDPTTWTTRTTKIAREGDILMSVRAPVGPVNFVAVDKVCIGRGLAAIRSRGELNREFLFYQLLHLQTEIAGKEGAVFASINKSEIAALPIVFAPLPEQQRIVGILDKAFDGIATAKANTEKNLQNARAIFESHLQSVFSQRSEGWVVKKISEVAKHSLGKMLDKAKNKGVLQPYLRNLNVRWFTFDIFDLLQMPFLPEESVKYTAVKGDILICEGGYPGRAAIWTEDYPIYFQKALHRVRFNEPELNKWFLYYLYAQDKSGKLKQHFSGTGIQHFTGEVLSRFKLPLPPLSELRRAVAKFEELFAETQRLETINQRKLAALDALKKSLLHQAFTGRL
jgi:type I restriction enzyme S subunit